MRRFSDGMRFWRLDWRIWKNTIKVKSFPRRVLVLEPELNLNSFETIPAIVRKKMVLWKRMQNSSRSQPLYVGNCVYNFRQEFSFDKRKWCLLSDAGISSALIYSVSYHRRKRHLKYKGHRCSSGFEPMLMQCCLVLSWRLFRSSVCAKTGPKQSATVQKYKPTSKPNSSKAHTNSKAPSQLFRNYKRPLPYRYENQSESGHDSTEAISLPRGKSISCW
jgi:hypothetical protein